MTNRPPFPFHNLRHPKSTNIKHPLPPPPITGGYSQPFNGNHCQVISLQERECTDNPSDNVIPQKRHSTGVTSSQGKKDNNVSVSVSNPARPIPSTSKRSGARKMTENGEKVPRPDAASKGSVMRLNTKKSSDSMPGPATTSTRDLSSLDRLPSTSASNPTSCRMGDASPCETASDHPNVEKQPISKSQNPRPSRTFSGSQPSHSSDGQHPNVPSSCLPPQSSALPAQSSALPAQLASRPKQVDVPPRSAGLGPVKITLKITPTVFPSSQQESLARPPQIQTTPNARKRKLGIPDTTQGTSSRRPLSTQSGSNPKHLISSRSANFEPSTAAPPTAPTSLLTGKAVAKSPQTKEIDTSRQRRLDTRNSSQDKTPKHHIPAKPASHLKQVVAPPQSFGTSTTPLPVPSILPPVGKIFIESPQSQTSTTTRKRKLDTSKSPQDGSSKRPKLGLGLAEHTRPRMTTDVIDLTNIDDDDDGDGDVDMQDTDHRSPSTKVKTERVSPRTHSRRSKPQQRSNIQTSLDDPMVDAIGVNPQDDVRRQSPPHISIQQIDLTKPLNSDEIWKIACNTHDKFWTLCSKKLVVSGEEFVGSSEWKRKLKNIRQRHVRENDRTKMPTRSIKQSLPFLPRNLRAGVPHLSRLKFPYLKDKITARVMTPKCFQRFWDEWDNRESNVRTCRELRILVVKLGRFEFDNASIPAVNGPKPDSVTISFYRDGIREPLFSKTFQLKDFEFRPIGMNIHAPFPIEYSRFYGNRSPLSMRATFRSGNQLWKHVFLSERIGHIEPNGKFVTRCEPFTLRTAIRSDQSILRLLPAPVWAFDSATPLQPLPRKIIDKPASSDHIKIRFTDSAGGSHQCFCGLDDRLIEKFDSEEEVATYLAVIHKGDLQVRSKREETDGRQIAHIELLQIGSSPEEQRIQSDVRRHSVTRENLDVSIAGLVQEPLTEIGNPAAGSPLVSPAPPRNVSKVSEYDVPTDHLPSEQQSLPNVLPITQIEINNALLVPGSRTEEVKEKSSTPVITVPALGPLSITITDAGSATKGNDTVDTIKDRPQVNTIFVESLKDTLSTIPDIEKDAHTMKPTSNGLAGPFMSDRNNEYTDWSTRIDPGTLADLFPALDDVWNGGKIRHLIRDHEEAVIWTRYHLTEGQRFLACCWNRWVYEKGPIPISNRLKYYLSFIEAYGQVMIRAGITREIGDLLQIHWRDKYISLKEMGEALKVWNEISRFHEKLKEARENKQKEKGTRPIARY